MHSFRRGVGRGLGSSTFLTVASLAMLGASGCGLVLGLGDFEDTEDGAGAAGASAATTGGGGPGTGAGGGGGNGNGGTGVTGGGGQGGDGSGVGGMVEQCPDDSACVPAPPVGWTGPAMLYHDADAPVPCPDAWPTSIEANAGEVTGDVSCDACSCAAPAGVQCSVPTYNVYSNSQCTGGSASYSLPANGTCLDTLGGYGAKVGLSMPSGGSCGAVGGTKVAGPVTWEEQALVCSGGALAVCPGGVCAPTPQPPFGAQLCVYKDGEEPGCPLAYPNLTHLYRGANDTRTCSDCTCGLVGGALCGSVVSAWANGDCSGFGNVIEYTNGTCNTVTYYNSAVFQNVPTGGSCPASGGTASGGVSPTLPLTVCCQ